MPTFGDVKEDQHKIEPLTHEITDLLIKSEKRLKRLSAGGTSDDSNIRKNVQAERSQKRGGMIMCATVLVIMCFIMDSILWRLHLVLGVCALEFDIQIPLSSLFIAECECHFRESIWH